MPYSGGQFFPDSQPTERFHTTKTPEKNNNGQLPNGISIHPDGADPTETCATVFLFRYLIFDLVVTGVSVDCVKTSEHVLFETEIQLFKGDKSVLEFVLDELDIELDEFKL